MLQKIKNYSKIGINSDFEHLFFPSEKLNWSKRVKTYYFQLNKILQQILHSRHHNLISNDIHFDFSSELQARTKIGNFKPSWGVSLLHRSQRPRIDLNKMFLPRPNTTTAWKLIPHRSKISKNWNPPWWELFY